MGAGAKNRSKLKRLMAKRARKASNEAKYAAWRRDGENTKSFRAKKRNKKIKITIINHINGFCGNPACYKCFDHSSSHGITKNC